MSDGIPWRYLWSHLHHLRLSHRLCNPMLSHCYLLFFTSREREREVKKEKKKNFFYSSIFHKASTAWSSSSSIPLFPPFSSRESKWRCWITRNGNHLHLMVRSSLAFFLCLSPLILAHNLQTHFINIFHFESYYFTLAINLDFRCVVLRLPRFGQSKNFNLNFVGTSADEWLNKFLLTEKDVTTSGCVMNDDGQPGTAANMSQHKWVFNCIEKLVFREHKEGNQDVWCVINCEVV